MFVCCSNRCCSAKVSGIYSPRTASTHDDVIKWKQWRGALMFSLICVWINGWVNNREAGDLSRYRAHYDVTVMYWRFLVFYYGQVPIDYTRIHGSLALGNHNIVPVLSKNLGEYWIKVGPHESIWTVIILKKETNVPKPWTYWWVQLCWCIVSNTNTHTDFTKICAYNTEYTQFEITSSMTVRNLNQTMNIYTINLT